MAGTPQPACGETCDTTSGTSCVPTPTITNHHKQPQAPWSKITQTQQQRGELGSNGNASVSAERIVIVLDVDRALSVTVAARNLFDVIKYTLVMFARYKVIRDAGTQFSLCCLRTHAEWLTDWTTNPMHIAEALTSLKADRSYTSCDMSSLFELLCLKGVNRLLAASPDCVIRCILVYSRPSIVPSYGGSRELVSSLASHPRFFLDVLCIEPDTRPFRLVHLGSRAAIIDSKDRKGQSPQTAFGTGTFRRRKLSTTSTNSNYNAFDFFLEELEPQGHPSCYKIQRRMGDSLRWLPLVILGTFIPHPQSRPALEELFISAAAHGLYAIKDGKTLSSGSSSETQQSLIISGMPDHTLSPFVANLQFSDVELIISAESDKRVPAHKVILAARSEWFKNTLQQPDIHTISIPKGIPYKTMISVLEFLYTYTTNVSTVELVPLCLASDLLRLGSLREYCLKRIRASLNTTSWLDALKRCWDVISARAECTRFVLSTLEALLWDKPPTDEALEFISAGLEHLVQARVGTSDEESILRCFCAQ